ncbi:hypothetical protein HD806DRAFT_502757 [Xylariaceae sp. AK1471]|nr:hypothetical protein HD806DRAFT_502757 [Xylariaceae sp. AK1471]
MAKTRAPDQDRFERLCLDHGISGYLGILMKKGALRPIGMAAVGHFFKKQKDANKYLRFISLICSSGLELVWGAIGREYKTIHIAG